jgi:hypothetical protein
MQETYNSFASTYWEAVGAMVGQTKTLAGLNVGDNLTGAVIDVSDFAVGIMAGMQTNPGQGAYGHIIKGTPNAEGDYLALTITSAYSQQYSNRNIVMYLYRFKANVGFINTIVLLQVIRPQTSDIISSISQKKNTQILQLDGIDFGIITASEKLEGYQNDLIYTSTNAKVLLSPTTPEALVNLPYLRSKIGYSAAAEIELGEAGDYTSEALWLRSGFVIRELKAVMTNSDGQTRGIAADKISFNSTDKTITITVDEDLTGWTAKAQVIYDVEETN